MKDNNSIEIIEKIKNIENLDEIITRMTIKMELESRKPDKMVKEIDQKLGIPFEDNYHNLLSQYIGDYESLTEDEIIDKLVILQKEKHIFGGNYITRFNNIKKHYLKSNYNIDWITPEESNPGVEFF